ncbi:MAG TPA: DUF3307 domain-containing protein [Ginsengibacter sp.]
MIVLLKLFLAHFIGDFLLQPEKWVKAKEEKKLGAWQLYTHSLLHGLLFLLLMWDINFWGWALLISFVHFVIDSFKLLVQKSNTRRLLFFIDQFLHFISIYAIWLCYEGKYFSFSFLKNENMLLLITLIIFLTRPVSFSIKIFISKWTPDTVAGDDALSLQSAGQYIGIFERLLVFIFMISNEWQAVGFLLAAKSVFRFGNLQEAKDRKLTEYILIGTLLSFGIAILTGMGYQYIKSLNLF